MARVHIGARTRMRRAIPHYASRGCAERTVVHPRYICLCKSSLILRGNEISRGAGRRARLSTPGMNSLIARVSGTSRIADFYRGLFSLLLARLASLQSYFPARLASVYVNVNNPRESTPGGSSRRSRREFFLVVPDFIVRDFIEHEPPTTRGGKREKDRGGRLPRTNRKLRTCINVLMTERFLTSGPSVPTSH